MDSLNRYLDTTPLSPLKGERVSIIPVQSYLREGRAMDRLVCRVLGEQVTP